MKGNLFPIIDCSGNELVSIDKDQSYVYELISPDMEMMDENTLSGYISRNEQLIKNFDENSFFKFYKIRNRNFLNTNAVFETEFNGIEFVPYEGILEKYFESSDFYSDINFFDDYINFNGVYSRIISVKSFSNYPIDYNFLPLDVDYVLILKKLSDLESSKKLDHIRTSHLGSFFKPKRDIDSENAYSEAEELLENIKTGNEGLFKIELFFILREQSLEELNNTTAELIKYFSLNDHDLFIEGHSLKNLKSGLFSIFRELIPGIRPTLRIREHTDRLGHVVRLLPLRRSFLMNSGLDVHDINDQVIRFNPFDASIVNKNTLVSGMSGAGKSVFVNKIVHHFIKEHPTVILDKGGSFKKLCLYHEGLVLNHGFNPIQFRDPVYLREIILSVVDNSRFSKLDRGKLLSLIKEILSDGVKTFWSLINKLESTFEGISYYFEDIKDFLNDDKLDNCSILYVDLEAYPKNIISPLIIFLLEYFKNFKEKEKILVFDECWSFLKDHGDYIDECFRTFRKTGAFPVAISQSLSDFENTSELSSSIVNNSYFKILFPQEIGENSSLSSFDRSRIKSLGYQKNVFSECYLKSADDKYRKILRVYLSKTELELFNTEASSFEKFYKYLENHRQYFSSNKETIDSYIRMKYA